MSIRLLAEAPTPIDEPATREERLSAALDDFALACGARAVVLADDHGLPCAACAGTGYEDAALWAAAAARALEAADAIQHLARRFGPGEAVVGLDGDQRLVAHRLRAPGGPLVAVLVGPRPPSHDALVRLERAVAAILNR